MLLVFACKEDQIKTVCLIVGFFPKIIENVFNIILHAILSLKNENFRI